MAMSFEASVREILVLSPPASERPVESGDWNAYDDIAFAVTQQAAEVVRPSVAMRLESLPEHLEAIERDPSAPDVPDRLNEVVRALDDLAAQGEWPKLVAAVAVVVRGEDGARTSPHLRSY